MILDARIGSLTPLKTLCRAGGKEGLCMKKNLEQKKEELIVDLLSTCCANNCLVALIILFNAKKKY